MIASIIGFSVRHKGLVVLATLAWIAAGLFALRTLPIDAVPDITNNQVQVVATAPSLAPQEVERFITYPVEVAMANIPGVVEIRSISRFGLSVVTVVFADRVPTLTARQYVREQLTVAEAEIPPGLADLGLMPITTGLGEIYQYTLQVDPAFRDRYDAMALREIQDWIVKRQMAGIEGIVEVSSFGGFVKQVEVAVHPERLQAQGLTLADVHAALLANNANSGGSYLERGSTALYIRMEGQVQDLDDVGAIPVSHPGGLSVRVRDVATVRYGSPMRYGAMTADGLGETVGGITLMLKGANSAIAIASVRERVEQVQGSLPEGVTLEPYLDREQLVDKTIHTASRNLIEGGLIVIVVLIFLLGNWRAGMVVASVIPLSMLFAFMGMALSGVSANLMSLGAIDFGIVVDGAVIIVEGVLFAWYGRMPGMHAVQDDPDALTSAVAARLSRPAVFGILIILVVFLPVLTLTGIEGKMFRPMALTVSYAILGALILSLTYVPALTAWMLRRSPRHESPWAERVLERLQALYRPSLRLALRMPGLVLGLALALLVAGVFVFRTLGSVFIPTLEEGDLAMQMAVTPGSSLSESIRTTTAAESILLENFPEVKHVVSKIGTAEVPTDPMAIEDADIMIILKDKSEWTSATTREELIGKMKDKLAVLSWASFEFTQPIQLRFNELMTGAKTDIAVKVFGEDIAELARLGDEAAALIAGVPGAGDVKVEQTDGLPQLRIRYDREKAAAYGLSVDDLNMTIRAAYAGEQAGVVFEGERKFDLVLRLAPADRQKLDLGRLLVPSPSGPLPLSAVASWTEDEGPMQVSREDTRRRITVGVNVRDRDMASFVGEIQETLSNQLELPPGYYLRYGGQFENLVAARKRLALAVPASLLGIFLMLYLTLRSFQQTMLIYTAVPLGAVGGILALAMRGMPFSISAGIGFIALFGVAVLNGLVLIGYLNDLRSLGGTLQERIISGAAARLRPVLMTASVASLGFLPMALSTSAGAEVQKPLATVVIGGLISSTLLTLVVLPALYLLLERRAMRRRERQEAAGSKAPGGGKLATWLIAFLLLPGLAAQAQEGAEPPVLSSNQALETVHAGAEQPVLSSNQALDAVRTNADQPVLSLAQALQAAQANSPWLDARAAERERDMAIPTRALDPGMTSVQGQFGQINGSPFDRFWTVEQQLPNPLQQARERKAAKASGLAAEANFRMHEAELAQAVCMTWASWVYHSHAEALARDRVKRLEAADRQAARRVSAGESDALELGLVSSRLARASAQAVQEEAQRLAAAAQLWTLTGLEPSWQAPDSLPPVAEDIPIPNGAVARMDAYQARTEAAARQARVPGSAWFPDVSLGYFRQTLEQQGGFQGFQAGLSLPVAFGRQGQARQQAEWQWQLAEREQSLAEQEILRQAEAASGEAERWARLWNERASNWATEAEQLRQAAERQRAAGEIDAFAWVQAWDLAQDLDAERLATWLAWWQASSLATYLAWKPLPSNP